MTYLFQMMLKKIMKQFHQHGHGSTEIKKTYVAKQLDTSSLPEIVYEDIIEIKWHHFDYFIRPGPDGNINKDTLFEYFDIFIEQKEESGDISMEPNENNQNSSIEWVTAELNRVNAELLTLQERVAYSNRQAMDFFKRTVKKKSLTTS